MRGFNPLPPAAVFNIIQLPPHTWVQLVNILRGLNRALALADGTNLCVHHCFSGSYSRLTADAPYSSYAPFA